VVSPVCRSQAWLRERSIGWWLFKFSEGHIFPLRRSFGRSYIETEAGPETDPSQSPVTQFTAHLQLLRTGGGDAVGRITSRPSDPTQQRFSTDALTNSFPRTNTSDSAERSVSMLVGLSCTTINSTSGMPMMVLHTHMTRHENINLTPAPNSPMEKLTLHSSSGRQRFSHRTRYFRPDASRIMLQETCCPPASRQPPYRSLMAST
jgi:hypothetical protein